MSEAQTFRAIFLQASGRLVPAGLPCRPWAVRSQEVPAAGAAPGPGAGDAAGQPALAAAVPERGPHQKQCMRCQG